MPDPVPPRALSAFPGARRCPAHPPAYPPMPSAARVCHLARCGDPRTGLSHRRKPLPAAGGCPHDPTDEGPPTPPLALPRAGLVGDLPGGAEWMRRHGRDRGGRAGERARLGWSGRRYLGRLRRRLRGGATPCRAVGSDRQVFTLFGPAWPMPARRDAELVTLSRLAPVEQGPGQGDPVRGVGGVSARLSHRNDDGRPVQSASPSWAVSRRWCWPTGWAARPKGSAGAPCPRRSPRRRSRSR